MKQVSRQIQDMLWNLEVNLSRLSRDTNPSPCWTRALLTRERQTSLLVAHSCQEASYRCVGLNPVRS